MYFRTEKEFQDRTEEISSTFAKMLTQIFNLTSDEWQIDREYVLSSDNYHLKRVDFRLLNNQCEVLLELKKEKATPINLPQLLEYIDIAKEINSKIKDEKSMSSVVDYYLKQGKYRKIIGILFAPDISPTLQEIVKSLDGVYAFSLNERKMYGREEILLAETV